MDNIKLELVKIARDLCFNEYTDRRAQLHNKWLVESEHLWRTQRLRLAYPDMPVYPGEADIMTRAEKLYAYINSDPSAITAETPWVESSEVTVTEPLSEPSVEPLDNVIALKQPEPQIVLPAQTAEPVQETPPLELPKTSLEKRQDAESKLLELIKEQSKLQTGIGVARTETTTNKLIPGIINKINDIRNNLGPPGPPKGAA